MKKIMMLAVVLISMTAQSQITQSGFNSVTVSGTTYSMVSNGVSPFVQLSYARSGFNEWTARINANALISLHLQRRQNSFNRGGFISFNTGATRVYGFTNGNGWTKNTARVQVIEVSSGNVLMTTDF